MRKLLAVSTLTMMSLSAFAAQTLYPVSNARLEIENNALMASGVAKGKDVKSLVKSFSVLGKVAGKDCGKHLCMGSLSLNQRREVILNARIDQDQDGNIDGQEQVIVGHLQANEIVFSVPVKFTYVEQRYSLPERMTGLKNAEWISVTINKN